jgi:enoyl-CoA hydratase/carnithine racemase
MASGEIATVWIDNPPLNVLTPDVLERLGEQLRLLDPATRVVVLRGRGERGFSAGADLARFAAGGPVEEIQRLADLIESLALPVVAAIHGYCLGGGLELALACDVRVARADAQLALPETGLGLIPGGGGTQRAPRLIGPGRAAWLIMSGERISAARAEAWGLVEFVVDDLDAGLPPLVGQLAGGAPAALARAKRLLLATREQRDDTLELDAFTACLRDPEGQEGIAAFLEKRPPSWRQQ